MTDNMPPTLDEPKLDSLGTTLFKRWQTYVTDRKMIEERWLRNLRQVRKIYDPETLKNIPTDRSKAYPGVTQWMVRGTIARLMQMLFPNTEKNYGIKASPLPDLPKEQLQQVLDALVQEKIKKASEQNQQLQPAQVQLTDEEIEKAIVAFAAGKAERMEVKVNDDLQGMEFITLARKVVKSAVTYNTGIAVGPQHVEVKTRTWYQDANSGQWLAKDATKFKPQFDHLTIWDHYPDMTAVSLDKQDGNYDRHIMTRPEVEALAGRPDFFGSRVREFLSKNTVGNYKAQWWETEIKGEPKSGLAPVASKETRKFEALSYRGYVSGHDMKAAGIDIADGKLGENYHANAWMIGETLIKLVLSPFDGEIPYHHYFVFEDDDLTILGSGQCDVLRDSQMSICETARAALDNMSVVGPQAIVDEDHLVPGQDMSIRKHKTWRFEDLTGNKNVNSVLANVQIDSHLTELKALLDMFMSFAQQESGLPPPSMGDVSQGGSEALRTTDNASAFLGAAALPIRDTVRNYDSFTISLISALVKWNMKYDPNPSRDGDHDVIARGSTTLISKEVLGRALNDFRASISPDEAPHIKTRAMLVQRMKAHDLPVDELLEDEAVANETIQRNAAQHEKNLQAQDELLAAQVEEALSNAMKNAALARKADGSLGVEVFETIIAGLEAGAKARAAAGKTVADLTAAAAKAHIALNPPKPAKRAA